MCILVPLNREADPAAPTLEVDGAVVKNFSELTDFKQKMFNCTLKIVFTFKDIRAAIQKHHIVMQAPHHQA